mgnify:CR=1 FL=1
MLLPIVSLLCGYKLNLQLKLTSYQFIKFYLATERAILRKKQNKTKKQVKERHCCFRLGRESEAQSRKGREVYSSGQGPVSQKSRNFSGSFRVTSFSLYLQNEGVSRHETLQLFSFLFPLQHMKRAALPNKRVGVLRMAFRARKKFGTFEKRAPGRDLNVSPGK